MVISRCLTNKSSWLFYRARIIQCAHFSPTVRTFVRHIKYVTLKILLPLLPVDWQCVWFTTTKPFISSSSSCSWRVRSVILFLNPQDEVGSSISSLVVPCSFVLSVYIVMLVLVVYLRPSSVRVVATFSGTVLFPLLYSVLLFFP